MLINIFLILRKDTDIGPIHGHLMSYQSGHYGHFFHIGHYGHVYSPPKICMISPEANIVVVFSCVSSSITWIFTDSQIYGLMEVQVCKCASVQVCKCTGVQVYKCASVQVCKRASVQVCKCVSVQVCKCANI